MVTVHKVNSDVGVETRSQLPARFDITAENAIVGEVLRNVVLPH
jgi:hypothetical protein